MGHLTKSTRGGSWNKSEQLRRMCARRIWSCGEEVSCKDQPDLQGDVRALSGACAQTFQPALVTKALMGELCALLSALEPPCKGLSDVVRAERTAQCCCALCSSAATGSPANTCSPQGPGFLHFLLENTFSFSALFISWT